jgi:hypothetical protein
MKRKPGARTKSGGLSGAGRAQLRDMRAFAPPGVEVRGLPHHVLEHGDIGGRVTAGRAIIQLVVNDYVLETLMTFDADTADLEPEPDEEDGPRSWSRLVRPKIVDRRRAVSGSD